MADETITNAIPETKTEPETKPETKPAEESNRDESAELAKLRAEMAKQKQALDKATKEAGDYKKMLRAKQTEEEIAAEEKKAQEEAMAKELAELRKRFAVAETSKKVMSFVGDEETANNMAEYLYGAEDVDAAIAAFQKAWTAKEKALRLEFGKIPAPGVGSSDGVSITREQLDAMRFPDRIQFMKEHREEYEKLMGR